MIDRDQVKDRHIQSTVLPHLGLVSENDCVSSAFVSRILLIRRAVFFFHALNDLARKRTRQMHRISARDV